MDIRSFFGKKTSNSGTETKKKKSEQNEPEEKTRKKQKLTPKKEPPLIDTKPQNVQKTPQNLIEIKQEISDEMEVEPIKKTQMKVPPSCQDSLKGLVFTFSGVLNNLTRGQAEDLVKSCGGQVSDKVTRKTKYLVAGEYLDDGETKATSNGPKYKEALKAQHVKVLTQNEFYNIISEKSAVQEQLSTQKKNNQGKGKGKLGKLKIENSEEDMLWPDKHRPKKVSELIGCKELASKLSRWLADFEPIHVNHSKPCPKPNLVKLSENRAAKAVLLSGPPGIGKSSLAHLIGSDSNFGHWEICEFNASDVRSKKILQQQLSDLVASRALAFDMKLRKRLIIMDEVDGMSRGDYGGMAELIAIIKKTRTPIICICNDRASMKIRSLANHCYDLRMKRPNKNAVATRLLQIINSKEADKFSGGVDRSALDEIIEQFGNDIRQLLNFLQMWAQNKSSLRYEDVKNHFYQMKKDEVLRLNPFNATQQILSDKDDIDMNNRTESYFVDYDLMPLMIQENYIQALQQNRNTQLQQKLEDMTLAADYLAEANLAETYVRRHQRWDLLTKQAALNVGGCVFAKGFVGRPEFTRWMGKNSTTKKSKRLLSELSIHMRTHASGSREAIRMDYIPYMQEILLHKLLLGGESELQNVIDLLDACEISKDDLCESMAFFQMPRIQRHKYSGLDSKTKASFTRKYNKGVHRSQALVETNLAQLKISKKKTSKKSSKTEEPPDENDIITSDIDLNADDDTDNGEGSGDDGEVFQKKTKKNESKKRKAPKKPAAAARKSKKKA